MWKRDQSVAMANVVLEMQRQQGIAHEPLFSLSRTSIDLDVLSLKCPIALAAAMLAHKEFHHE